MRGCQPYQVGMAGWRSAFAVFFGFVDMLPHPADGEPDKEGDDRHRRRLHQIDVPAPDGKRQRLGEIPDKPDSLSTVC